MHQDISEQHMHNSTVIMSYSCYKYCTKNTFVENCPEIYVLVNLPLKSIFEEFAQKDNF